MSSIDVFLFSSAPSGPQKTLILGVYGISNLVMCAKRVILSLSNQFPSLELHNREQNGRVDDLSASKVKGELHKCLNEPVTVATVLLPRGLINSGNLCFLNATLQALLSCSPFVQLLQELRTRKVPKSSSLNLTCLVVQVQRTKMQVFLRLVGLLALPCLKAFFKFLLQMYELASRAGQGQFLVWFAFVSLTLDADKASFQGKFHLDLDDEVRVSRTSVTLLSILKLQQTKNGANPDGNQFGPA
ncbi:unnamed protein product [Prunus armeniaca]|uniref:Peptidase C19 ubiquitin carboxyl-terminal hydrolase domain-containing protein n=1 Tax=Prunus armeniaca TaxID=36596 RepID=A0A6J5W5V3_PRUAR|nr:unnamed protein product [Prunus armeniaca]CAB4307467.1 unnamed protein product [Prunus armeniaca]